MQVADLLDSQVISGDNAQLLGAVGVETLVALSQSEAGVLLEEIENANSHLGLVEQLPDLDQLVTWIDEARNRLDEAEATSVTRLDEVIELIPISAVKAYPVSKESILENKIEVRDVPVMDEFLEGRDLYVEEVRKIDSESSEIKATVREISSKTPTRKISSKVSIALHQSVNIFLAYYTLGHKPIGVEFLSCFVLADFLVHERLSHFGLISLIVSTPSIAYEIDHHVFFKFSPIIDRQLRHE